jgi:hypothetical protein
MRSLRTVFATDVLCYIYKAYVGDQKPPIHPIAIDIVIASLGRRCKCT